MAGWIDVAIPGVIGLWLAVLPQSFYRSKGDRNRDRAMIRMLRGMGAILLVVAAGYLLLKVASRG
jgi:hypothetical protein